MATSDASSGGEAKDESSSVKKISRLSMAAQVPPIRDGAASTHAEWEVHSTTVELDVSSRTNRDASTHNRKSKSWKGPLPPATSSPPLSLGDIVVRDSRSHGAKGTRKCL
jgi:hypothetical protein